MQYAVIAHSGKQYKVAVGDTVAFDHIITAEPDTDITFSDVLFVADGDKRLVGTPTVTATVTGKVVGDQKGVKVRVAKFKAKARYRKVRGFRATQTVVAITGIKI